MRRVWQPFHLIFVHFRLCPGVIVQRFKGAREDKAAFYDEGSALARQRQQDKRRIEAIKAEVRGAGPEVNFAALFALMQVIGAGLGVGIGCTMVGIRIGNLQSLTEHGLNGEAHLVAMTDLVSAALMVVIFLGFLFVGVTLLPVALAGDIDAARASRIGVQALMVVALYCRETYCLIQNRRLMQMIRVHELMASDKEVA